MNTDYLHYFELAYKEGNFSAAARRVPVSPQGLTKAIHALEKDLGVTLFSIDDETGSPVPTEYAHELFQFAQIFDSNMHILQDTFDNIRGEEHYTVCLGCSLGVLGTFGPEFLDTFRQINPSITIDAREAADNNISRDLQDGVCDIALIVGTPQAGFECQDLYQTGQYFWVNLDDPLAQKDFIEVSDLEGREIAIPGAGFDCYERLLADCQKAGVQTGRIYQMSEIFQLYEFASSGRGLGFSVEHLIDLPVFVRDAKVVAKPFAGHQWHFGIMRLAAHALTTAEYKFWSYAQACAKKLPRNKL